ncbi:MAG TPA: TetR/AcrR family transcriptional regulator [Acidimicrobiales bacterium]|nr:TetR/AcrR family transcriptional regulator [Acidimicrobiales bacterium]
MIDTAERVVRAGGFEQMTIRSLAAELDVAPMSLYRHVRDKDDLLGEVVDRMLAGRWRPRAGAEDWVAWMTEAADRLRAFLVSQPAALHIYLHNPVVSPAAVDRMSAMLEVLGAAGFAPDKARHAYAAVHTYTLGFAALEVSRARARRQAVEDGTILSELERELGSFTSPRRFREGLGYLLDGIAAQR